MTAVDLRPSPIAGTWYDRNPDRLGRQVDEFINSASLPELHGRVVGIMAPHAGYIYSGPTAGYAFKAVKGHVYATVVVFSPLHVYHPAPLLTSGHQGYETPLGRILIDQDAIDRVDANLHKTTGVHLTPVLRDPEHSLEIELPFLQRSLAADFQLLPVMVRTHSEEILRHLGEIIASIVKDRTCLLVASTDLSHFNPEKIAKQYDQVMLENIRNFSPEGALQAEQNNIGFACGVGAVAAMLWTARSLGADTVQILHHSTSADATGDTGSVVGYGAAVILQSK